MRKFATLCGVLAVLAGCEAASEAPGSCEALTAPPLAACVVEVGAGAADMGAAAEGVTTDLAGPVVEAGTGAPPDDCRLRGPGYDDVHGASADVLAPARWFRLADSGGGKTWTVWLLMGDQAPTLAVGDEALVHAEVGRARGFEWTLHGGVTVTRPDGALVAWVAIADVAEELPAPEGVTFARGAAICEHVEHCGEWAGYELEVRAGDSAGTVPYGAAATVGGLRVLHGGLREQTTETDCTDWSVAEAAVAMAAAE